MGSFDNPVLVQYRLTMEKTPFPAPSVTAHLMLRNYLENPDKAPWCFATDRETKEANRVLLRICRIASWNSHD